MGAAGASVVIRFAESSAYYDFAVRDSGPAVQPTAAWQVRAAYCGARKWSPIPSALVPICTIYAQFQRHRLMRTILDTAGPRHYGPRGFGGRESAGNSSIFAGVEA